MWKTRVVDARNLCDELEESARAGAHSQLQQLKDRCDQAENAVLRLQQLEGGWDRARSGVDRNFEKLEETWRAVHRALRPSEACASARKATWPF